MFSPGRLLTIATFAFVVRRGLAGNLCRCTGYEAIYRAIHRAS
jgi:aerobic-type carbon monoxide dehydrogenase small subunit (CoxS/CutS family)